MGAGEVDGHLGVVMGGAVGAKARHEVVGSGGGVFVGHEVKIGGEPKPRESGDSGRIGGDSGHRLGVSPPSMR
jgi:hypothetical protein